MYELLETGNIEKKSLRFIKAKNTDWSELAKDCVAMANAAGGLIYLGIEDDADSPPSGQRITDRQLPETIQKNISRRIINVQIAVTIDVAENTGEYISIEIFRNTQTIASTTDGRYYVRVSDQCRPVPPDEMARLAADKNAFVWEIQTARKLSIDNADPLKKKQFLTDIRNSDRVSSFIKEKSESELLEYYLFTKDEFLTNLGILWIGKREDRATMLYAPAIQIIRYDAQEQKVWKLVLDDYSNNPKELLEKVLDDVPDWSESLEISDGIFRKNIPMYPIEVVRELVANALVHRTYTTRGDIFINIFRDRFEVHSPGRLPYGVTPANILHQSVRRNEQLSKVFYDLGLMEKEGSGYDLIYSQLLGNGKSTPTIEDSNDRVTVSVSKQIVSPEIVKLMDKASREFQLRQKEIITLGLIAQNHTIGTLELTKILNQNNESGTRYWLGRLLDVKLVLTKGKTRGTQYYVNPEFLRKMDFKSKTDLVTIEDHRLEELIFKDISEYPNSGLGEIHERIGPEINPRKINRIIKKMKRQGVLLSEGVNRWTLYSINTKPVK